MVALNRRSNDKWVEVEVGFSALSGRVTVVCGKKGDFIIAKLNMILYEGDYVAIPLSGYDVIRELRRTRD